MNLPTAIYLLLFDYHPLFYRRKNYVRNEHWLCPPGNCLWQSAAAAVADCHNIYGTTRNRQQDLCGVDFQDMHNNCCHNEHRSRIHRIHHYMHNRNLSHACNIRGPYHCKKIYSRAWNFCRKDHRNTLFYTDLSCHNRRIFEFAYRLVFSRGLRSLSPSDL